MTQQPIHVLLVEDDPGDARLIREMLFDGGDFGFALATCGTLRDGMTHVDSLPCDVILLDLTLPDSAGIDTLFYLRKHAPEMPIVVLTGLDDMTVLGVQAVQRGAQDYLVKGDVDSKLLRRSIRYAIERFRIETALRQSEQEYRSLIDDVFDTSMVAVIILDRNFKVVWCNEATEIYFGVERTELLGRDKRRLIDDILKCVFADPDDYASRLLKAYGDGSFTDRFECHILPGIDREERWLEHWSQPIHDGRYAGGRIEQYTDITDRKLLEIAELEQREFAEALRDIAALLTSTLDLNDVLGRILNNLGRIVPHDSASITMLEDDHIWVARQRHTSKRDTQEIVAERQLQVEYRHYLDMMYATRQPVLVADLQQDSQIQAAAFRANVHAYIGAPILLQEQIIGFINLFCEHVDFYHDTHRERLSAFAELAAIAIQNARLFQQSQALAALEERQRLARELHDSVSQTIFTSRAMAETALRRWEKDPVRAREIVEDVLQLSITALAEMRILLLELRPAALTQVTLKQLFEQYLQPIQERRQFKLAMTVDEIPPLPPMVQIALYRITQEALNNIDKHAQAANVEICVTNHEDRVELMIRDDGHGFELDGVGYTSMGLSIMRERAEEIGAQLEIDSKTGQGTRITVTWIKDEGEGL